MSTALRRSPRQRTGAAAIFGLCTITTEPKGDKFPQMKTGNKNERLVITLSESDGTLTVQGCHPLRKR